MKEAWSYKIDIIAAMIGGVYEVDILSIVRLEPTVTGYV